MRYKVFPILRYGNFPLDITTLYFPPYLILINFLPRWILYRIPFTLILNRGLDVRKIRNLPLKLILRRLQPVNREREVRANERQRSINILQRYHFLTIFMEPTKDTAKWMIAPLKTYFWLLATKDFFFGGGGGGEKSRGVF